MLSAIWNSTLVLAIAAVAAAYQAGAVAPGDAFFLATAIVLVFTGQQLVARDEMTFSAAATSLASPASYRSRLSFLAYVACLALGTLVAAQTLALA